MHQILVIASREITRLRNRFAGNASPITVVLLIIGLGLSAFAVRSSVTLGTGLYRVAVSGDVPAIQDSRFSVVNTDPAQAKILLEQHAVDVWIDGRQVQSREDDRSLFAVRALKQDLEIQELNRIGGTYAAESAFPLRVGINYLTGEQATGQQTPTRPEELIIPSLTPPPAPFTHVLVSMLYIIPITFISIFFTTSFMDEKVNRRLSILLSAPITPFQIIMGKMLPYATFALTTTALIAWITRTNVALALAIFAPTILFIFAIYLMVPLLYRTFKDTTFIAMMVTTLTTSYLIFPAMFTNTNELAYISPLTLAVKMYRNEPFGWREYLFPSLPMASIFALAMFAGTRMLNEEYLMGYRPITRKITDAIYLMMAHIPSYISVPFWSVLVIPGVYMAQIIFLAFATNLPLRILLLAVLGAAALVEETVKSIGIVVLVEHGVVKSKRELVILSFLSALGFLVGEKLLLLVSLGIVEQAPISGALFGAGVFLLIPLLVHFACTTMVVFIKSKTKLPYTVALALGTVVHFIYNWVVTSGGF